MRRAFQAISVKGLITFTLLIIAVGIVAADSNSSDRYLALSELGAGNLLAVIAACSLGFAFATLRLRTIASDLGYCISLRQSAAAVSLGQIGGAVFFQLVGQLMARVVR